MSSLAEILRLAGVRLNEIFAENPRTNSKIETTLAQFDKEMQTRLLSAMEAIKDAGPNGITPKAWVEKYADYHGAGPIESALEAVKLVAKQFSFCIRRASVKDGQTYYAWYEEEMPSMNREPEDMNAQTKSAIDMQVGLTYTALEAMREMKTFTAEHLANWFNRRGFDPAQAERLADHMLTQFRGMLTQQGDVYTVEEEPVHTDDDSMKMFKSFATNPRNPDA